MRGFHPISFASLLPYILSLFIELVGLSMRGVLSIIFRRALIANWLKVSPSSCASFSYSTNSSAYIGTIMIPPLCCSSRSKSSLLTSAQCFFEIRSRKTHPFTVCRLIPSFNARSFLLSPFFFSALSNC